LRSPQTRATTGVRRSLEANDNRELVRPWVEAAKNAQEE
jgi:hypothetical protein